MTKCVRMYTLTTVCGVCAYKNKNVSRSGDSGERRHERTIDEERIAGFCGVDDDSLWDSFDVDYFLARCLFCRKFLSNTSADSL